MKLSLEVSDLLSSENDIVVQSIKSREIDVVAGTWVMPPPPNKDPAVQLLQDLRRNILLNNIDVSEFFNNAQINLNLKHNIRSIKTLISSKLPAEISESYSDKIDWLCTFWSQAPHSLGINFLTAAITNLIDEECPTYFLSGDIKQSHSINFENGMIYIVSKLSDLKFRLGEQLCSLPGTVMTTSKVTRKGIFMVNINVSNLFLKNCLLFKSVTTNQNIADALSIVEGLPEQIMQVRSTVDFNHFANTKNPELWYAEFDYSLSELEKLVMDVTGYSKGIQQFKLFLTRRLQRILMTDVIYPHSPNHPLSHLCKMVAERLRPFFPDSSALSLLISTVELLENQATGTKFDDSLRLTDFILSQTNKRFIEIGACFDFAADDADLKHTSLFADSQQGLTREEKDRVINHSREAKAYYSALVRLFTEKTEGSSIGARLRNLADELRKGGAHGGEDGSELNSGERANVAILNFARFLESLDNDTRETVFACRGSNNLETFGQIWERLSRPADANFRQVIFCVEIIAGKLDDIISNNNFLFNLRPSSRSATFIEDLQKECQQAKLALDKELSSDQYKLTVSYGDSKTQEATFIENFCVTIPWSHCVAILQEQRLKRYFLDYRFVARIFKRLTTTESIDFTTNICTTFGKHFLAHTIARSADGLGHLLDAIPENARPLIIYSFMPSIEELPRFISNSEELSYIVTRLHVEARISYLKSIQKALPQILDRGRGLGYFVSNVPQCEWTELLKLCIPATTFPYFFENAYNAAQVYSPIMPEHLTEFVKLLFKLLGISSLRKIIQTEGYLKILFTELSKENMEALVKAIGELLGEKFISSLIPNYQVLLDLQQPLTDTKKISLIKIFSPYLSHLRSTVISPAAYLSHFDGKVQEGIIRVLPPDLIACGINNCNELAELLSILNERVRAACLSIFGSDALKQKVVTALERNPETLASSIAQLKISRCEPLLLWLGAGILTKLVQTSENLGWILDAVPEGDRFTLLEKLHTQKLLPLNRVFSTNTTRFSGFALLSKIAPNERIKFLRLFKSTFNDDFRVIRGWDNLQNLIEILSALIPASSRIVYLCELIGRNAIVSLIRSSTDLFSLLVLLPGDNWSDVLNWLGPEVITGCISTANGLASIINRIRYNQNSVATTIQKESAINLLMGHVLSNFNNLSSLVRTNLFPYTYREFLQLVGMDKLRELLTTNEEVASFFTIIPNELYEMREIFIPKLMNNMSGNLLKIAYVSFFKLLDANENLNFLRRLESKTLELIFSDFTITKSVLQSMRTSEQKRNLVRIIPREKLKEFSSNNLRDFMLLMSNGLTFFEFEKLLDVIREHISSNFAVRALSQVPLTIPFKQHLIELLTKFIQDNSPYRIVSFFSNKSQQVELAKGLLQFIQDKTQFQNILDEVEAHQATNSRAQSSTQSIAYDACLLQLQRALKEAENAHLLIFANQNHLSAQVSRLKH